MMSNEYLDTMQAFFRNRPRLNSWQQQKADETKQSDVYYQAKPLQPQDQARVNQKVERILDATTVLDQASEQASQATELAVESVVGFGTLPVVMGLSLGSLFLAENALKKAKNPLLGLSKYLTILGAGVIPTLALTGFSAIWGAQQETRASRIARLQTRQAELANPNRYALFTEEQKQIAAQKATHISNESIEAEEKAKNDKTDGIGGAFHQLKTLVTDKNAHERDALLNKVNERLNKPNQAFLPQSEKELKEDAALVSNITRTINDRSESYTENIENAFGTLATGLILMGGLSAKVIGDLIQKKMGKDIGWQGKLGVFVLLEIPLLILGTRLERDGAKVARWKARQDIKNNPNSMLAVPDEDKASVQGVKDENFKPKGILDSFKQAFTLPFEFMKDHKAYQAWEKTEGIEEKKRRKALDQIQLSPEQMQNAKRLQARTHEAFNLTDEYSQDSEMMEASTDILQEATVTFPELALYAPAPLVLAGHYIPTPKVKWLEKTAKAYGIAVPKSDAKKWEPLLNNWRLETLTRAIPVKVTEFLATALPKVLNGVLSFQNFVEDKPILKYLKPVTENILKESAELTLEMTVRSLPIEFDASEVIKQLGESANPHLKKMAESTVNKVNMLNPLDWIKEGFKYTTLRYTVLGVTIPVGLGVLLGPILLINSVFTRWQKDSMRVGLMQADDAMKHPNFFKLDGQEKQRPPNPTVA